MTNNLAFPCKDCPDRHRACHDSCQKYRSAKLENENRKQWDREHKYLSHHTENEIRADGVVWRHSKWNGRSGRAGGKFR